MNVYCESNFVLELALVQEQHLSCERILGLCEAGKVNLIVPAYCLVEPYETAIRRARERRRLATDFAREVQQLIRSEPYKGESEVLQGVTSLLVRSTEEEKKRLDRAVERLASVAEVIRLEATTIAEALGAQESLGLSPQDSLVYASILQHLTLSTDLQRCFLNRNTYDFDDPDIVATFGSYNCRVIARFDNGYDYIRSQVGE
jgi:predicted nucleic acid-binding protein